MTIRFHRNFERQYRRLRPGERERCKDRIGLFMEDLFNPVLNNHPLRGAYEGYRSINAGGDLRLIYKSVDKDLAIFVTLGTHDKLYG